MLQLTLKPLTFLGILTGARCTSDACTNLMHTLSLENTTIIAAGHITGGQNISTPGSCQSSAFVTTDVCRVYAVVNTTTDSAVHFEMWLPDTWFGRFLALGNGGLAGCNFLLLCSRLSSLSLTWFRYRL